MTKIKLLNKEENKVTFILEETNAAVVNTLRRLIIEEVPTMAIKEARIVKNGSALYDEMLAHRLGLIPFITDLKSYDVPVEGKKGPRYQLKMVLKVSGPKKVLASDIKIKDPKVKPVYPEIPIVELLENQSIEMEMTAVLGSGKEHNKFSPGLVYYKGKPSVKLIKPTKNEKIVNVCPTKVFEMKTGKVSVINENDCILCNACTDISKDVIVKASDKNFIVTLESWGQLNPVTLLKESTKILDKKVDELEKALKTSKK